jgi:hypothetical protein
VRRKEYLLSYDVSIWCTDPFHDPSALPQRDEWVVDNDRWVLQRPTWTLSAGPSVKALPEDIPDEVLGALPGIAYLVGASLQPIGAPKAGFAMLRRVAATVAKAAHGAIFDPQQDTLELPGGVKRFVPPPHAGERHALLEMSWWWDHSQALEETWVDELLDVLQRLLPEGMPRRYGLWEPPQYTYAETGREHLAAFMREHHSETVVWYANRPVSSCSFLVVTGCEWRRLGASMKWRSNHASVAIEASVLSQPGWPLALRRFWEEMSLLLQPFFGEVRTLRGYAGRPPQFRLDQDTEPAPTRAWWWMGIPPNLGHAAVVGEPYRALWQGLESRAEFRGGLLFVSTDDWRSSRDAAEVAGGVPPAIALPFMPHWGAATTGKGSQVLYPEGYPAVFPFGDLPPGAVRWDGQLPPELGGEEAHS